MCLPGGGGVCPGLYPGGLSVQGGVSAPVHAGIHPRPVDRMHMLVKILPCRNYVADGNNAQKYFVPLIVAVRYHLKLIKTV